MRRYKKIAEKDKIKYTKMICELISNETKTHLMFTNDKYTESLVRVMDKFPKFVEQLSVLVYKKIIVFDDVNFKFKWNRDKTSIAWYFKNMKKNSLCLCGDFWADIEEAFDYERGSLRYLSSKNGRGIFKPSEHYEEIIKLFPDEKEEKYMDKIRALEDMFNENSDNYFWKDDGTDTEFVEWCEAKFAEIKKIIDS
jgi:hypothetical protein